MSLQSDRIRFLRGPGSAIILQPGKAQINRFLRNRHSRISPCGSTPHRHSPASAFPRNPRKPLHDRPCLALYPRQFNPARHLHSPQRKTHHLVRHEPPYTSRGNRYAEPGSHQPHNRLPVCRFLNDARLKAILLEDTQRPFIGLLTRNPRVKDKRLIPQHSRRNALLPCALMVRRPRSPHTAP